MRCKHKIKYDCVNKQEFETIVFYDADKKLINIYDYEVKYNQSDAIVIPLHAWEDFKKMINDFDPKEE